MAASFLRSVKLRFMFLENCRAERKNLMAGGEWFQLSAVIMPEQVKYNSVLWFSDDEDIYRVFEFGSISRISVALIINWRALYGKMYSMQ